MSLFRTVIILVAAILLYLPVTSQAAFFIKKSNVQIANENNHKIFTAITTTHTESTATGKTTFLGRVAHKIANVKEAFSAGKKKWVAILLGFLDVFVLGFIGLPRFYMGYTADGVMQLIFTLLGAVGVVCLILAFGLGNFALLVPAYLCIGLAVFSEIWQIVDLIRILCNSLKPKAGYWDK